MILDVSIGKDGDSFELNSNILIIKMVRMLY